MTGKGQIAFGGVVAGAVYADMTFDNGSRWEFSGFIAPEIGVGFSVPVQTADFPGFDHIEGGCWLFFGNVGAPVGAFFIRFADTKGDIGKITAMTVGGGIGAGTGGGVWKKK